MVDGFGTSKYSNNELQNWNVGLITKSQGKNFRINNEVSVSLIVRRQDAKSTTDLYYIRKSHIISPNDEFIDLTANERESAQEATLRLWREKGKTGEPKRLNGDWVRNEIRPPDKVLLLIYLLDPEGAELNESSDPIVGFAVSFPGSNRDDAVTYAVHSQLLQNFDIDEIYDTMEDEDDED